MALTKKQTIKAIKGYDVNLTDTILHHKVMDYGVSVSGKWEWDIFLLNEASQESLDELLKTLMKKYKPECMFVWDE